MIANTSRYTAVLALGTVLATTAGAGCTDVDTEPVEFEAEAPGLTGIGEPVITGDGSPSSESNPAAITFSFDPVETDDGRMYNTLRLIPEIGGAPSWDPASLDPDDPSTFPPAGFAFAVEIRDLAGQLILESEPRLLYPSDFMAGDGATPVRPFASAEWTFYPVSGDAVEICPLSYEASEWLDQIESMVLELVATLWLPIEDEPVDDTPPIEEPGEEPPGEQPIEITEDTEDVPVHGDGLARMAGSGHFTGQPYTTADVMEVPDIDDSWAEIILTCWDAANEVWHWYDMYEKKCFKGMPPVRDLSLPGCLGAISGLTTKSIMAAACAYIMADKMGLVPSSEAMRKLARSLLVSYALSGKPKDLPKLPPPPAIVKPKD